MNVVDSSGWIEFFTAGTNGLVFKAVIEQQQEEISQLQHYIAG